MNRKSKILVLGGCIVAFAGGFWASWDGHVRLHVPGFLPPVVATISCLAYVYLLQRRRKAAGVKKPHDC